MQIWAVSQACNIGLKSLAQVPGTCTGLRSVSSLNLVSAQFYPLPYCSMQVHNGRACYILQWKFMIRRPATGKGKIQVVRICKLSEFGNCYHQVTATGKRVLFLFTYLRHHLPPGEVQETCRSSHRDFQTVENSKKKQPLFHELEVWGVLKTFLQVPWIPQEVLPASGKKAPFPLTVSSQQSCCYIHQPSTI